MNPGIIRECGRLVRSLRSSVARLKTVHVNREDIRVQGQGLVDGYFRTDRPILLAELKNEALFGELDSNMQELLRCTQRRTTRARFLEVLGALERGWNDFEIRGIPNATPLVGHLDFKQHQDAILNLLQRACPAAGHCYRQALVDLAGPDRISWRGTVSELREALRELLDKLAPDESVRDTPGFKLEEGARGPTMKQKARFILKARRLSESDRKPVEDAAGTVEDNVGAFVRTAYTRSSVSVHTEPERKDVVSVLRFVELALSELLDLDG